MNNLKYIVFKELREVIRDKKSLAMMLIVPLMVPLIIFGMSYMFESMTNKPVTDYNKIGFNYELSEEEKTIAREVEIDPVSKTSVDELKKAYENGEISLYIIKNGKNYEINGENTEDTNMAIGLANSYLSAYQTHLQATTMMENGINPSGILDVITVSENITEKDNFIVSYITSYGFLFVLMALTLAAIYPATDTIAGEKERGTLETLLTFPISKKDIIVGKFISVTMASAIAGIISFIFMNISLGICNGMFDVYKDVTITLSAGAIIYSIIAIIAFALLVSGLAIAMASKTKSYKEAQSALTPLSFLAMFPGMIAIFAKIETTSVLSAVPFLNVSLLFADCVKNKINWLNICTMFVSSILYIIIILKVIIKQYKSEKVLF